ncbi:hypothetical protein BC828DRAFT_384793 [Blastocladiella britannica]|nr:hypothetical protein BC828DRAFT_384793 [Blastocladiella britannica]
MSDINDGHRLPGEAATAATGATGDIAHPTPPRGISRSFTEPNVQGLAADPADAPHSDRGHFSTSPELVAVELSAAAHGPSSLQIDQLQEQQVQQHDTDRAEPARARASPLSRPLLRASSSSVALGRSRSALAQAPSMVPSNQPASPSSTAPQSAGGGLGFLRHVPPPMLGDDHLDLSDLLAAIRHDVSLPPADQARAAAWVTCFCVVGFDLELGPTIEATVPPTAFSEAEIRAIRFNSFPDSNTFLHGDLHFSFQLRRCGAPISDPPPAPSSSAPTTASTTTPLRHRAGSIHVSMPSMDDEYLYASVFFRQLPDSTIRRGFYQKSIVVLSPLYFPGLWNRVSGVVGPVVCERGLAGLETAHSNISKWQPPTTPGMHELPILGEVIQAHIPALPPALPAVQLLPALLKKSLGPNQVLSATLPGGLFPTFADVLDRLWTLWELVLTNQPIVVISSCPAVASRAVESLVAMIRPIPHDQGFRPYLTIQDPDGRYFTKHHPPPRTIVGVTNPHFHTVLDRWPNVLQVGPPRSPLGKSKSSGPISQLEIVQGLTTKHKRVVARDQKFLAHVASLVLAGADPVVIDNVLRRHFADLTDMFLAPLRDFCTASGPPISLVSSFPPPVAPFRHDAFFDYLSSLPEPPIPLRSVAAAASRWLPGSAGSNAWLDLYRAFLRAPPFFAWHRAWEAAHASKLAADYARLVGGANLAAWWAAVLRETGGRAATAAGRAQALVERVNAILDPASMVQLDPALENRLRAQLGVLAPWAAAAT